MPWRTEQETHINSEEMCLFSAKFCANYLFSTETLSKQAKNRPRMADFQITWTWPKPEREHFGTQTSPSRSATMGGIFSVRPKSRSLQLQAFTKLFLLLFFFKVCSPKWVRYFLCASLKTYAWENSFLLLRVALQVWTCQVQMFVSAFNRRKFTDWCSKQKCTWAEWHLHTTEPDGALCWTNLILIDNCLCWGRKCVWPSWCHQLPVSWSLHLHCPPLRPGWMGRFALK